MRDADWGVPEGVTWFQHMGGALSEEYLDSAFMRAQSPEEPVPSWIENVKRVGCWDWYLYVVVLPASACYICGIATSMWWCFRHLHVIFVVLPACSGVGVVQMWRFRHMCARTAGELMWVVCRELGVGRDTNMWW